MRHELINLLRHVVLTLSRTHFKLRLYDFVLSHML